ncbi:hypothetical protein [Limnoglobus roseus]|uniref:Uncharacterized protein n=1 Tax=Limnoglobus roseus TaxID=2598579 RepID=A0A5C1AKV7_9BACT|nr:hypothetical protein [Limnoglobus roseus]QEL17508.1 hypothetical protein PX52LOC_04497 [Limnoglobus roseus]
MRGPSERRSIENTEGTVRRVDPVGRVVEVRVGGVTINFDVRPDCVITLRGERVKLRMLEPRDRVRVTYTEYQGTRVADAVEVSTAGPAPV